MEIILTFGTIANPHLISRKLFIPANNKTPTFQLKHRISDPITPQPAEPDADSPDVMRIELNRLNRAQGK